MNPITLPSKDGLTHIAVRGDTLLSNQQWWQRLYSVYQQVNETPHQKWLLFADDSFDFSCCLFALLLAGRTPILPPNQQYETLVSFQTRVDAVCSDKNIGKQAPDVYIGKSYANHQQNSNAIAVAVNHDTELHLYTSGSTGEPKCVVKKWRQLLAEVETLETYFSKYVADSLICSSVSHQHIYGLLFTVLWPLLSQKKWQVKSVKYPEDYSSLTEGQAISFISSPSFLEYVLAQPNLTSCAPQFCVSSGGLLKTVTAEGLADLWGQAPTEVFGSSETGGVAYRNQQQHRHWRVFSCIEWTVSANQALQIRSPYLVNSHDWYVMDDAVEVRNDGFALVGRLDRVVKVAEKRVCLEQMANQLLQHHWVKSCDLITLSLKREHIAAVVVLNHEGRQALSLGKRSLNNQLRQHLTAYFEAVTVPRKWRYVDSLPVNLQGKRQLNQMRALFL
ncbi:AMP-binding protein [Agarivorans sp. TSD2052]|uniref:AMP-binding protein n=1 Tax=Agarivorans sp. TSD2052 TaxID=2937286 RepID=UPI00200E418D|nr:AMP-binding protein [Agarivorans sp. TSD2052]UPW19342.1 AMP-binding protein [Agarivorans sp. TSD2052]